MALARKQLSVIHLAKKRLGLADDDYRAILTQEGGVSSAAELDGLGFQRVMDRLAALGFKSDWRERTLGDRPGMATPAQVEAVRRLWREWHGADDDAALGRWLDRSFKVSALRFLDREAVDKAINGLRAMVARRPRTPGS